MCKTTLWMGKLQSGLSYRVQYQGILNCCFGGYCPVSCDVVSGRQEPTSLRDLLCYPEEGFLNIKVATRRMILRPRSILSLLKMCSDSTCHSVEEWTTRKQRVLNLRLSDVAVQMWAVLPKFRTNLVHIHGLRITLFRKMSLLYGRCGQDWGYAFLFARSHP